MTALAISIPTKKVSAWLTETEPRHLQAWLASLPYADSAEAAREIFQSLYTLNRIELSPQDRFELLDHYRGPIDVVAKGLQSHFAHGTYPLSPSRHQLAGFVRQLFQEMAAGYKCCLWDQSKAVFNWGKKQFVTTVAERAILYLGEVLMRSYRVYLPYPAGVWREINEIFRYIEDLGRELEPVTDDRQEGGRSHSITQRYLEVALTGLTNPYQLPQDACVHIANFLERWADKARILRDAEIQNPAGQFLIDLSADAPPTPFPRHGAIRAGGALRVLSAIELVRTVHSFIARLQKGESARKMDLGFEQPDTASLEVLQRMMRAWGLIARRRHSRIKRSSHVFLCVGSNAVHFFASGQKPFQPPEMERARSEDNPVPLPDPAAAAVEDTAQAATKEHEVNEDAVYVSLDDEEGTAPTKEAHAPAFVAPASRSAELYRIDRWRVRDISPRGMSLACDAGIASHVRVGDVVGLQQINAMGRWNVAVVRWLKTPEPATLEIGIELLGAEVRPAAVRRAASADADQSAFVQALWVPAIESLHQPPTLLMPRGMSQTENDLELIIESEQMTRVRVLKRGERSNSFEQVVFAEVAHEEI